MRIKKVWIQFMHGMYVIKANELNRTDTKKFKSNEFTFRIDLCVDVLFFAPNINLYQPIRFNS